MSASKNGERGRTSAGIILVNQAGTPIFFNTAASTVLSYCGRSKHWTSKSNLLPPQIHSMLSQCISDSSPAATGLTSGRRRYLCSALALSSAAGVPSEKMTVLLLERVSEAADLAGAAEHFNLTKREQQTVGLLTLGLTSKEIAARMSVSPNTVKTFFRLVMTKMGVNTRAGIVGKIARM